MKLRYVCAQPASTYYSWQIEVMLNNFMEMGINPNHIDVVCWKVNDVIPDEWSKLANAYPARFFFYSDTRETKHYISSIRPNILKQHFKLHPYLKEEAIFYHDCDIVFTKPAKWDQFLQDDKWYGSDTRWYISHSYIVSKGQDVMDKMCEIVGIDEEVIKANELNSIGAQYLMKDIDSEYWEQVEKDCERLFHEITELNNEKVEIDRHTMPEGESRQPYHPLQIWCADMWAVLWNGWKLGKQTICHPDFDFAWGTSSEDDWNKYNIFHNAGVVESNSKSGLFYKGEYIQKSPFKDDLIIRENTASKKYWEIIKRVAKKSVL